MLPPPSTCRNRVAHAAITPNPSSGGADASWTNGAISTFSLAHAQVFLSFFFFDPQIGRGQSATELVAQDF